MGWKGVVRSIGAAARASERDARRRQRELTLHQKNYQKMQVLDQAAHEVGVYQNRIELIRSLHRECGGTLDWKQIVGVPAPNMPEGNDGEREQLARASERSYKPGFLDRLLSKESKRRKQFAQAVLRAIGEDRLGRERTLETWQAEYDQWGETNAVGIRVLEKNARARLDVVEKMNPFSEITALGSHLSFSAQDGSALHIVVKVHGIAIIPIEAKSLLQSGRLSVKKMPKAQFNELHQDYVCSCALRVARELFAILPEQMVVVTAVDDVLDRKTGHLAEVPILSVAFSRATMDRMNLDGLDPSDSMQNFVHNMSFKKATGFEAVQKLDPAVFSD